MQPFLLCADPLRLKKLFYALLHRFFAISKINKCSKELTSMTCMQTNVLFDGGNGCSLNIVFFEYCKIYSWLWPFSVCVHWTSHFGRQIAGRIPALQQDLAEFRKSNNILRKNTMFNEHPVVVRLNCYNMYMWKETNINNKGLWLIIFNFDFV